MGNACWKKTNSPYGKSYDNRGHVCNFNGTVKVIEAGVVLGILGLILVVLAVGWIVRYSRRASRFRAFWNQTPVDSHALGSTASFETHELKTSSPGGPRSPSSPRSPGEKTLYGSVSGGGSTERLPKYAVPRSTSRPQSMMASNASIASRRSSVSNGSGVPTLRPISTAHPPVRSSPLASGQPKPDLSSRPQRQGSTSTRSPLAGGGGGSGSASSDDGERGAFIRSRETSFAASPPSTYGGGSYGHGGLQSPGMSSGEFGGWDHGQEYHPSSPGPIHDMPLYNAHVSPSYNPSQAQYGIEQLHSASPTPSVGQVFAYQQSPPASHSPQAQQTAAYHPFMPNQHAQPADDFGAVHSPLDRLSFAHPRGPNAPHQAPGPPRRMFSDVSEASSGGLDSPPSSPVINFSRPTSRTG